LSPSPATFFSPPSSDDMFILKQCISLEWIACNVRGQYRVTSVVWSPNYRRIASSGLREGGLTVGLQWCLWPAYFLNLFSFQHFPWSA
jgi:hypothetical protein